MQHHQYCWEISVFFGKNQSPVQTVETFGHRSQILTYAQRFVEADRFEATPKPIECITDSNFTYDAKSFEAMKVQGAILKEVAC